MTLQLPNITVTDPDDHDALRINIPHKIDGRAPQTDLLTANSPSGILKQTTATAHEPPSPTPTLVTPSVHSGISGVSSFSGDDAVSLNAPPSPTLSTVSAQNGTGGQGGGGKGGFPTTLALRDNKPEDASGLGSLSLLSPEWRVPHQQQHQQHQQHGRHPSHSSTSTVDVLLDDGAGGGGGGKSLRRAGSHATSITIADGDDGDNTSNQDVSPRASPRIKFAGDDTPAPRGPGQATHNTGTHTDKTAAAAAAATGTPGTTTTASQSAAALSGQDQTQTQENTPSPHHAPLSTALSSTAGVAAGTMTPAATEDDGPASLGPFTLRPLALAALLDPKSLDALRALGGVRGVMRALGTHPAKGLLLGAVVERQGQGQGQGQGGHHGEHGGHVKGHAGLVEGQQARITDGGETAAQAAYGDGRPGTGTLGGPLPSAGMSSPQQQLQQEQQQQEQLQLQKGQDGGAEAAGAAAAALPVFVVTSPGEAVGAAVKGGGGDGDMFDEEDEDEDDDDDDDCDYDYGSESSEEGKKYAAAGTSTLEERKRVYGANVLPERPSKTFMQLVWLAVKDKVLILLMIAAAVSLALGLFQDFGTPRAPGEKPVDWVEGVAILVAILIVVGVGSVNDWQKERQFRVLARKKDERGVKVVRGGVETVVDIKDVVVGDVALLEPGEIVPCDGIFLAGHNLKCDESGATGESDAIKKAPYRDCLALRRGHRGVDGKKAAAAAAAGGAGAGARLGEGAEGAAHTDCFIVSGSKVLEGVGSYVVVAVGQKSFNGRIMMALRGDPESTPLQIKLNNLAELIAKIGSAAGLILFTALMIKFFVQLGKGSPKRNANEKGIAFVNILIISVTVVVVAVPEGLPLAVTLALAFATKRMTRERLLVRVLASCETMANASVVCTDKTGTLTQNEMTVVAGSIGVHAKFVRDLARNRARSNAGHGDERGLECESEEGEGEKRGVGSVEEKGSLHDHDEEKEGSAAPPRRKHCDDFSVDFSELNEVLPRALQRLLNAAICVNSTAFADQTGGGFVGSKTETALLGFARELGWRSCRATREAARVVQMVPFSSARKAMGVVVRLSSGRHRFYVKGASEILTERCVRYVVVRKDHYHGGGSGEGKGGGGGHNGENKKDGGGDDDQNEDDDDGEVEVAPLDEMAMDNIQRTIIFYANQTLRTIALCYRDFEEWPPRGVRCNEEGEAEYEDLAKDLTFLGVTGIEDPLRPGVCEAVAKCQRAGVAVKMCTGDNVLTARSIASQCGIYGPGGIIMEGPVFRSLSDTQKLAVVPRLQVLARSSPEDKKILVTKLKELGEVVGVTGDGTNDGPALKTAHVGFSMGIAGTEVAKEASDIILMDDNFSSIVKAIIWGRCVNDAVRKFLQFQVAVNVTAVVITMVSSISATNEQSVLSAVQLLWINIIMDTFAALALATDPATEALLDRKPDAKNAPLFSVNMYKQILFQSVYQIIIILLFHFAGRQILRFPAHPADPKVATQNEKILRTLVFNAFVFAQIANSVNSRRLDRKLNIFEGLLKNYYFMGITILELAVQVLIVFVGGDAFQVTRIGGREWGISLALGVVAIPIGAAVRLLPNEPFEKLFTAMRLLPKGDVLPTTQQQMEWSPAVDQVRDGLRTFGGLRGGRLRASSYVVAKTRVANVQTDAAHQVPALLTMIPSMVVSGVTTNWKLQPGSLSDPASADPSKSSAALWEGKMEVHPDTNADDPAFKLLARHVPAKAGAGSASNV